MTTTAAADLAEQVDGGRTDRGLVGREPDDGAAAVVDADRLLAENRRLEAENERLRDYVSRLLPVVAAVDEFEDRHRQLVERLDELLETS